MCNVVFGERDNPWRYLALAVIEKAIQDLPFPGSRGSRVYLRGCDSVRFLVQRSSILNLWVDVAGLEVQRVQQAAQMHLARRGWGTDQLRRLLDAASEIGDSSEEAGEGKNDESTEVAEASAVLAGGCGW